MQYSQVNFRMIVPFLVCFTFSLVGSVSGQSDECTGYTLLQCNNLPFVESSDDLIPPLVLGQPNATEPGLTVHKIYEIPGQFVRVAVDPMTKSLILLQGNGNLHRLSIELDKIESELLFSHNDVGGGSFTQGLAIDSKGTIYVLGNERRSTTTRGTLQRGVLQSDGSRIWSNVMTTEFYPKSNTDFDHFFTGIAIDPTESYVYVASGSRTDHGEIQSLNGLYPDTREVPLTSAIFRLPIEGENLLLPADEEQLLETGYLYADGLRNAFGLSFSPTGELWAAENGPHADYPDELNIILPGEHYGFPWKFAQWDNGQQFPDYNPDIDHFLSPGAKALGTYVNDSTFPPAPTGPFVSPLANYGPDADIQVGPDGFLTDASQSQRPIYSIAPHRSPLGLNFVQDDSLPSKYQGGAFMLSFGRLVPSRLPDVGRDLLFLKFEEFNGKRVIRAKRLVENFDFPIDGVFLHGKFYVLEFGSELFVGQQPIGTIWEITFS